MPPTRTCNTMSTTGLWTGRRDPKPRTATAMIAVEEAAGPTARRHGRQAIPIIRHPNQGCVGSEMTGCTHDAAAIATIPQLAATEKRIGVMTAKTTVKLVEM